MNQIDRVTSNLRYYESEYWQKEAELSKKDIVNDFKQFIESESSIIRQFQQSIFKKCNKFDRNSGVVGIVQQILKMNPFFKDDKEAESKIYKANWMHGFDFIRDYIRYYKQQEEYAELGLE